MQFQIIFLFCFVIYTIKLLFSVSLIYRCRTCVLLCFTGTRALSSATSSLETRCPAYSEHPLPCVKPPSSGWMPEVYPRGQCRDRWGVHSCRRVWNEPGWNAGEGARDPELRHTQKWSIDQHSGEESRLKPIWWRLAELHSDTLELIVEWSFTASTSRSSRRSQRSSTTTATNQPSRPLQAWRKA